MHSAYNGRTLQARVLVKPCLALVVSVVDKARPSSRTVSMSASRLGLVGIDTHQANSAMHDSVNA